MEYYAAIKVSYSFTSWHNDGCISVHWQQEWGMVCGLGVRPPMQDTEELQI